MMKTEQENGKIQDNGKSVVGYGPDGLAAAIAEVLKSSHKVALINIIVK